MRNLLLFILLLIAIWWVRRALGNMFGRGNAQARSAGPDAGHDEGRGASRRTRALGQPEPVIACRQCGVHVPESEGVRDGDTFFCCEEHRRLFVRR